MKLISEFVENDIEFLITEDKKTGKTFFDRLPEAIQDQIVEHRKNQADNTNLSWSSYHDCPFVNKNLFKEYISMSFMDGTGRYRMIYKLMISVAANAIEKQYPITANQIVDIIREVDRETANLYEKRPLELEANNALEYAYKNGVL